MTGNSLIEIFRKYKTLNEVKELNREQAYDFCKRWLELKPFSSDINKAYKSPIMTRILDDLTDHKIIIPRRTEVNLRQIENRRTTLEKELERILTALSDVEVEINSIRAEVYYNGIHDSGALAPKISTLDENI